MPRQEAPPVVPQNQLAHCARAVHMLSGDRHGVLVHAVLLKSQAGTFFLLLAIGRPYRICCALFRVAGLWHFGLSSMDGYL